MGGATVLLPLPPAARFRNGVSSSISRRRGTYAPGDRVRCSYKIPRSRRWLGFAAEDGSGGPTSSEDEQTPTGSEPPPPPPPPRGAWKGIRWRELLLSRDPDNVVAVGLTGVLAWAGLQLLWQLLIIALAILVSALKYTLVAALLLFILITLL